MSPSGLFEAACPAAVSTPSKSLGSASVSLRTRPRRHVSCLWSADARECPSSIALIIVCMYFLVQLSAAATELLMAGMVMFNSQQEHKPAFNTENTQVRPN